MAELYHILQDIIIKSNEFKGDLQKLKFLKLFKKCHRITYTLKEDLNIGIGFSKIGGNPDLPKEINWPTYETKSMTFFCQINLSDLDDSALPKEGILYFFVYADPELSYSGSRESFKIIYHTEMNELFRNEFPEDLNQKSKFHPSKMFFRDSISYPDDESSLIEDFFNNWEDKNKFYGKLDHLMEHIYESPQFEDKVLGYDCSLQSSAEHFWPINYLNIKTWDEVDQRKEEIEKIKSDFVLLLEIDLFSNPSKLASYGGSPVVYFGIKREDLKNKKFDDIVVQFQDT
ncbi:YwqG family protein [Flavobacterium sp. I-SCBP12n]|uniref:YwqG family protein n=1 Tax=Flavobacterium pygoscelis TaxID=2893176 RepID=A0A9X2BRB4_9FLAO|nr:YwqG family protein [Flavobacterium pygoscelis]MCK8143351.1 YwqG family protein [Flavobacterium pygoscelis]